MALTDEACGSAIRVRLLDDWSPRFPGYHLCYPNQRQPSAAFALLVEALRTASAISP